MAEPSKLAQETLKALQLNETLLQNLTAAVHTQAGVLNKVSIDVAKIETEMEQMQGAFGIGEDAGIQAKIIRLELKVDSLERKLSMADDRGWQVRLAIGLAIAGPVIQAIAWLVGKSNQ